MPISARYPSPREWAEIVNAVRNPTAPPANLSAMLLAVIDTPPSGPVLREPRIWDVLLDFGNASASLVLEVEADNEEQARQIGLDRAPSVTNEELSFTVDLTTVLARAMRRT